MRILICYSVLITAVFVYGQVDTLPPSEFSYIPSDQSSAEFESYERQWKAKQFPEPASSLYLYHTPTYKIVINRKLFDRAKGDFSVRLLKLPAFGAEVLYSVRQEKSGEFVVERIAPTKAMIWSVARDAETIESAISYDFGVEVDEYAIDSVLGYELSGLWNDMLENVTYQRDDSGIVTEDGISYYYATRHPTLGYIEGESSNPRKDSIVGRATLLGFAALVSRNSKEETNKLVEAIKEIRKEIHLTSRWSQLR